MRLAFRHTFAGAAVASLAICALSLLVPPTQSPNGWLGLEQAVARGSCGPTGGTARRLSMNYMNRGVLCLVNAARRRHGLRPYRMDPKLNRAAKRHSRSMVKNSFFSHSGPGGTSPGDRIARTGYFRGAKAFAWGENIAAGKGRSGSPKKIFRAWMGSPGHRSAILSPEFREFGVGVARGYPYGGRNGATYTLDFAMRRG